MVVNVERLRSQEAKSNVYGVTVGKDVIVPNIIANTNIEWAASQEWGGEFCNVMQNICGQYTYNKVYSATTCIDIMNVLAAADESQDIIKAKSSSGMVNMVEEELGYIGALVESQHGDQATHDEAYATTSDIETSA